MISRIHVNQHVIRANATKGEDNPPLSIKRGGRTTSARTVAIDGPSTVVYSPDKPLSCGARVWIETTSPVIIDGGGR